MKVVVPKIQFLSSNKCTNMITFWCIAIFLDAHSVTLSKGPKAFKIIRLRSWTMDVAP